MLTEKPWWQNPDAYSNNDNTHQPPPRTPAITRRGVLAAAGAGVGIVVVTSVGQTVTPLRAARPAGHPAARARARRPCRSTARPTRRRSASWPSAPSWQLRVLGPKPFTLTLAELEALADRDLAAASFPISCVEGWSVGAHWHGLRLLDVVRRAGGDRAIRGSRSRSLEPNGLVQLLLRGRPAAVARAAGHPPQRRAARPRPRLPAAADRPRPRRRAEHQVADVGGGSLDEDGAHRASARPGCCSGCSACSGCSPRSTATTWSCCSRWLVARAGHPRRHPGAAGDRCRRAAGAVRCRRGPAPSCRAA